MSNHRRESNWFIFLLVPLVFGGCASELELARGGDELAQRDMVQVRTRPVCGNGISEEGEQCDDGNDVDGDGCNARCQKPCPSGALEIVSCTEGRTFDHETTVAKLDGTLVPVVTRYTTKICRTRSGEETELSACRQTLVPYEGPESCVSLSSPPSGGHVCAPTCDGGCPEGNACFIAFEPNVEPEFAVKRCMPAIGGLVGDLCGTCSPGLSCNHVPGFPDDVSVCMPEQCDQCPSWSICLDAVNSITREETDRSCFPLAKFPIGTRTTTNALCEGEEAPFQTHRGDQCERGCEKIIGCGGGWRDRGTLSACLQVCRAEADNSFLGCVADQSGCDLQTIADRCVTQFGTDDYWARAGRYCTQRCGRDSDCPSGFYCGDDGLEGSTNVCVAETTSVFRDPPSTIDLLAGSDCADDTDSTCTFGSDCDPDCNRPRGCGEVPQYGLCDGNRLLYCDTERVMNIDCAARGLECGFDDALTRYDCVGL